jgi:hypothetical protein
MNRFFKRIFSVGLLVGSTTLLFGKVTQNGDIFHFKTDWEKGKTYKYSNTITFSTPKSMSMEPMKLNGPTSIKVLDIDKDGKVTLELSKSLSMPNMLGDSKSKPTVSTHKVKLDKHGKLTEESALTPSLTFFKLLPQGEVKKNHAWNVDINFDKGLGKSYFGNSKAQFNCKLVGLVSYKKKNVAKIEVKVSRVGEKSQDHLGDGHLYVNVDTGLVSEFTFDFTQKPILKDAPNLFGKIQVKTLLEA